MRTDLKPLLQTFNWPVRVYWEDTDAGGVVYYANYLKFLERARTEWLSHLGLEQDQLAREAGVVFVVRRVEADYLMPAKFNDRLSIRCELAELGGASLSMHQQVLRDENLLLQARIKIVCVQQSSFRPVRMPDIVSQAFGALI
jgi:acyl-CoA thioester hydrolase